jgi:lipopolysaccharide export system protein LptA
MSYRSVSLRDLLSAIAKNSLACLLALSWAACAPPVLAERADRDKPVNIEADSVDIDDGKHEGTFLGNVQLTQGTLLIKADKIVVHQDAEGFQYGIAYGKPASFRQKREGFDEFIDGFGDRIEYDSKADTVQFFKNAHIKRGGDDVKGDYISYNAITEFFQVIGGGKTAGTGSGSTPTGRVTATIQPKPKVPPPAKPADPGIPLKSSDSLPSEKH